MQMAQDSLLKEILENRVMKDLEKALLEDKDYQLANTDLMSKVDKLETIELSHEQWRTVDSAISASNNCCAEYGRVAYYQGFRDALKLISELQEFSC